MTWRIEYKIKEKWHIVENPDPKICPHCGSKDLEWKRKKEFTENGIFLFSTSNLMCNKCNEDVMKDWVA